MTHAVARPSWGRLLTTIAALTLPLACGQDDTTHPGSQERGTAAYRGPLHAPLEPDPPFYGDPANGAVFGVDISHHEGPMSYSTMECFWHSGVRHVISGTQIEEITRQQLAMATRRGMTVDAYVYLYWNMDIREQVKEAFRIADGFPIQRMWLDVEDEYSLSPGTPLLALIQQALDACNELAPKDVACGIYTGPGFWTTHLGNTDAFNHVPLWYAWYNLKKSLSNWSEEQFGGWAEPTGKQWNEEPVCQVGVDKNTIKVPRPPTVVVNHAETGDPTQPPVAPVNLWPKETKVSTSYAVLMADPVPGATRYELALELWYPKRWNTETHKLGRFGPYKTWKLYGPFYQVSPVVKNTIYRFRARAMNEQGWGPWSPWAMFDFGVYDGVRPEAPAPGAPNTPGSPGSSGSPNAPGAPAASDGVPGHLSPDGTTVAGGPVTLSCDAVPGATRYEFDVDFRLWSGIFAGYTTFKAVGPAKVFTPVVKNTTYRWRVRAVVDGTAGDWSSFVNFEVTH